MSDIDRIIATCRRDSRCVSGSERRALCDEIERLRAERDACIAFIECEMQWCGFRADYYEDTVSAANARKLAEFLDRHTAAEAGGEG